MPDAIQQPGKKSPVVLYAAFFGAIVGALFARPVIRPWMEKHLAGFSAARGWPTIASFVPWILFSIYWEIKAKNSSVAISSESKFSRGIHVVLGNIALLLIVIPVPGLTQRLLPDTLIVKIIGLTAEFAGLALAIWARRVLGRHWSGEITLKADHELVHTGPYRTVRHPIYTALLAMYLGTAVVSGEMHALLGLAIGIIAYLRKVRMEESNLANAFGEKYSAYRKDTWALLPGVY